MNGTAELEGRYRLLLALYPAEHRRAHEDEMLGVLMTGARAGQGRPGLAEAADLIWGALRIRLRPTPHDAAGLLWRDALAVVSTVLPLIILVYLSVSALGLLGVHGALLAALARSDAESLAAWVILTACVMMRLRRIAALVAAGMLTWYAIPAADVPNWYYLAPVSMLLFVTLGLEAAGLLASPGPRTADPDVEGIRGRIGGPGGCGVRHPAAVGAAPGRNGWDHDHCDLRRYQWTGADVRAGQACRCPAVDPRLLCLRPPSRLALDGRRPLRERGGLGRAAPDHTDLPAARRAPGRDHRHYGGAACSCPPRPC
jgi:hypothetical protein